jgi:HEAT repeat protein
LGKVGEQTLPVFKSALQAEELSVRTTAAASLGNLVDQGAPAVEALLLALKDAHPDVQTAAVRSLGKFGSAAAAAVPDLQQLDATAEAPLKELIAATLNRIAGTAAPAAETPAVDAPAVEAPAVEAPAVEAPAVEAPAVEAPAVEAPAVDASAVEALPEVPSP